MGINKGLEKQLAKETFSLMVIDDEERAESKYNFYLEYTRRFPKELNEKLHSLMMNVYSLYKISNINSEETITK